MSQKTIATLFLVTLIHCFCAAQKGVSLIVDPPSMSLSSGHHRFSVRIANNSDSAVNILVPDEVLSFRGFTPESIGITGRPYSVEFKETNTCQTSKPANYRYLLSSGNIETILPGETKEIGDFRNYNLLWCMNTASDQYSFTLVYRPIVKLNNLTTDDLLKIELLRKRLRSIDSRIYALGLAMGSAGVHDNIRHLHEYETNDADVLSKITRITLTSNTVTVTK